MLNTGRASCTVTLVCDLHDHCLKQLPEDFFSWFVFCLRTFTLSSTSCLLERLSFSLDYKLTALVMQQSSSTLFCPPPPRCSLMSLFNKFLYKTIHRKRPHLDAHAMDTDPVGGK